MSQPLADATSGAKDGLASRSPPAEVGLLDIVQRSPDAFLIIDRNGVVQFANRAAGALFGAAESRLVGQPIGLPLTAGETADIDILPPGGEEVVAEMRLMQTEWGGKEAMVAVLRDVTERRRAERALRENERRLTMTIEVAQLGFWDLDQPSRTMVGNEKLFTSLGYGPGEVPTRLEAWRRLIHPEDASRFARTFRDHLAGRIPNLRIEFRGRTKSGEWRWFLSQSEVAEWDPEGRPLRLIGVTEDITERKLLEERLQQTNEELERRVQERTAELQRANAALERSNLELQQFAYIAAHDLQTPLRSIAGFAHLLRKDYHGRLDRQADSWLDRLTDAARHMHDLIRDVLAYSRVDSQGGVFQPVDFNVIFEEVVATLEARIRENGARVTREDLPRVTGDRMQLAQLLQNLIENALKYRADRVPQVHVSARRKDGEWAISVRDNGIGIPGKHLERIFNIFQRLHTQREYPGTGIGLAVCRRVILRHGGRIWAESELGQGSVFHFTLPDYLPESTRVDTL